MYRLWRLSLYRGRAQSNFVQDKLPPTKRYLLKYRTDFGSGWDGGRSFGIPVRQLGHGGRETVIGES